MYVIDTTLAHGGLFNWLIDVTGTVEIRRRFVGGQVRVIRSTDPGQDWWDKLEELEDNLGGLIAGVPERSLPEARGGE